MLLRSLLLLTVLLGTRPLAGYSASEQTHRLRDKLLFLCHFHKAGGTSMIHFMQDYGLQGIHDVGAHKKPPLSWLPGPKHKHPSTKYKKTFAASAPNASRGVLGIWSSDQLLVRSTVNGSQIDATPAGDPSFYWDVYSTGVDLVVTEYNFLQPPQFEAMKTAADFVAMVRDPWGRFHSTFEKELDQLCVGGQNKHRHEISRKAQKCLEEHRLVDWVKLPLGMPKSSPRTRQFPGMLAPNYYTRMLNGLLDQPRVAMNASHLQLAKTVIAQFDLLLYLEMNTSRRDGAFDSFFPDSAERGVRLGTKSNNFLKQVPGYSTIQQANLLAKPAFDELNVLDNELYAFIKDLVDTRPLAARS